MAGRLGAHSACRVTDHRILWVVKLVNEGKKHFLADVADDLSRLNVYDKEKKSIKIRV